MQVVELGLISQVSTPVLFPIPATSCACHDPNPAGQQATAQDSVVGQNGHPLKNHLMRAVVVPLRRIDLGSKLLQVKVNYIYILWWGSMAAPGNAPDFGGNSSSCTDTPPVFFLQFSTSFLAIKHFTDEKAGLLRTVTDGLTDGWKEEQALRIYRDGQDGRLLGIGRSLLRTPDTSDTVLQCWPLLLLSVLGFSPYSSYMPSAEHTLTCTLP